MVLERRTRARATVMVAAATFDPLSRSLRLASEKEERCDWITVALIFCSLLLLGVIAS